MVLWALAHLLVSVLLPSALTQDDAQEAIFLQSIEWVYRARNPPIYNWLLTGLDRLFGPSPLPFALLRYGGLAATAFLVYAVARKVIAEPRLQAAAVYGLSLGWVIGWQSHRMLTHSHVMIVAIAASMLLVALLIERRTALRYAALGVVLAIGVLSKFGFAAFVAALGVAILIVPELRPILRDPRALLVPLVAAPPVVAFALVMSSNAQDAVAAAASALQVGGGRGALAVIGAWAGAVAGYALPFVAIAALVFRLSLRDRPAVPPLVRAIWWMMMLGVGGTLAVALATESSGVRDRYFHVFLLFLPVASIALLGGIESAGDRARTFVVVCTAIAGAVLIARILVFVAPHQALCGACIQSRPYAGLTRALTRIAGPVPIVTTWDDHLAGNLRQVMPRARVSVPAFGYRVPLEPSRPPTGCVVIEAGRPGDPLVRRTFDHVAPLAGVTQEGAVTVTFPVWGPLLPEPRTQSFTILPLPPGSAPCRDTVR